MRLVFLSRLGALLLMTSFVVNLLALLELRDLQQQARQLQVEGQRALRDVSLIQAEMSALQKMVAVYVATQNPKLLIYYYDILDVHSGQKSFSSPPSALYWDTLLVDQTTAIGTVNQKSRSLQERIENLRTEGGSKAIGLELLQSSRELRAREKIIFAAAQGLYDVRNKAFVTEAPADTAYATAFMYANEHLKLTNEIEGQLNTLFDLINQKQETENISTQEKITQAGRVLLFLSLLSGVILLIILYLLRVGILKPIEQMAQSAGKMAEGDYSVSIKESKVVAEIGILSHSMNRMIRAVRFDLMQKDLARKATEAMYKAEQAREKAELETRVKSRFLANMTHELRTPLNAVIGMSQLLARTELAPKQKNYLNKVVDSAKFLLGLVNDILDFSKAEAGKVTLEMQACDLVALMNSSIDLVSLTAEKNRVATRVDVSSLNATGGACWIVSDPLRLKQILTNLLSNAVKFTHQGSVVLSAQVQEGYSGQMALRLSVSDTGIGMSEQQVSDAFEEFTQADQSTTRVYGGTGLGLAIVKRLAQALGGEIHIESTVGKGSCFSLEFTAEKAQPELAPEPLPVPDAAAPPPQPAWTPEPTGNQKLLAGLSILLVEDNPINQEVAKDTLELEGALIHICDNGLEAVEFFEQKKAAIDLILMDVEMPQMDGYQATRHIRTSLGLTDLPILGMTAHAFEEARDKCLESGMNAVMTKPFDMDALYVWIQRNFSRPLSESVENP